jgi:hypothetical protein
MSSIDEIGSASLCSWPDLLTASISELRKPSIDLKMEKRLKHIDIIFEAEVKLRIQEALQINRNRRLTLLQKAEAYGGIIRKTDRFLSMVLAYNSDLKRHIFKHRVKSLNDTIEGVLFG